MLETGKNLSTSFHKWENADLDTKGLIHITHDTGEKALAPHSSTLAWKIPWMEEPGRLQSMGSRRVGHN